MKEQQEEESRTLWVKMDEIFARYTEKDTEKAKQEEQLKVWKVKLAVDEQMKVWKAKQAEDGLELKAKQEEEHFGLLVLQFGGGR